VRIAYTEDDLLAALLVQFAARAIAKVFANEFESSDGIGNGVLEILSKNAKGFIIGDLAKYSGLFCGHFLSQFLIWGRRIIHFSNVCGGFGGSLLAAVKIVDAHFVAISNTLGEGAAKIRVKSVGHRFLDCNRERGHVLAAKNSRFLVTPLLGMTGRRVRANECAAT